MIIVPTESLYKWTDEKMLRHLLDILLQLSKEHPRIKFTGNLFSPEFGYPNETREKTFYRGNEITPEENRALSDRPVYKANIVRLAEKTSGYIDIDTELIIPGKISSFETCYRYTFAQTAGCVDVGCLLDILSLPYIRIPVRGEAKTRGRIYMRNIFLYLPLGRQFIAAFVGEINGWGVEEKNEKKALKHLLGMLKIPAETTLYPISL
jgi:hypothetical protein